MKHNEIRICAVVVTFNRLGLLKNCIDSIRNQSRKVDEIIVVNNSSTDGTFEWLSEQKDLTVITQPNSGSAGGQYTGIKSAYEKGYDWIWTMDDDVETTCMALEKLVEKIPLLSNVGYLVSNIFNKNREPINLPLIERKSKENKEEWSKYLDKNCIKIREATFVSLLVSSPSIRKCGYPNKELFIWGDDYEFTLRIHKFFDGYLVGDSIVYHLRENNSELDISKETEENRINNYFYYYKNGLIIMRTYYPYYVLFSYFINNLLKKDLIGIIKCKNKKMLKMKILLKGVINGLISSKLL